MEINSTHSDYSASALDWSRPRDVFAGEMQSKRRANYLPRLDSPSDEDYAAYLMRASFFGASARTLMEYVDHFLPAWNPHR